MKDCCKDAFIEGIKHIQCEIRHAGYNISREEIIVLIDYSVNLLERNRQYQQEIPKGIEL